MRPLRVLRQLGLIVVVLQACAEPVLAGPIEEGAHAFEHNDFEKALAIWMPLAIAGNAEAQCDVGSMYYKGSGVPQDDSIALKWLKLSADQGSPCGETNLGNLYNFGIGVQQDYLQALKLYRSAAEKNYAPGYTNLGVMYAEGRGVPQNVSEALKLLKHAAD